MESKFEKHQGSEMTARTKNRPHPNCQLETIRTENNESLEVLSRAVGMSASCLHKLQQGRDPKFQMALKIARHYKKPLTELWPDSKELYKEVPKENPECQRAKSKSDKKTAAKPGRKKAST